jgi:catechol 1,2-dioxygenase
MDAQPHSQHTETMKEESQPQLDRRSLIRYLSFGSVAVAAVGSGCGDDPVGALDAADAGGRTDALVGLDAGGAQDARLDASASDSSGPDMGLADVEVADFGPGPDAGPVSCEPTPPDVTGPFFRAGAPSRTSLVDAAEPGDRLEISGVVLDPDCVTPLDGAVIDVWQADASGVYDTDSVEYRLRALLSSDAQGGFAFTSVRPGNYPDAGGMRPAHVHFTVTRPGYRPVTTQLYFRGDPYLAPNDSCTVCNSDEEGLIIELNQETREGVTWWVGEFRIVLAI